MRPTLLPILATLIILSACTTPATGLSKSAASAPAQIPPAVPELADVPIPELEKLVESDNVRAEVELGYRYAMGKGVANDYGKAVPLFRTAAKHDDPQAEFFLATAYYSGYGVPKDEAAAALWFERSAQQHYAASSYWLGYMIAFGRGGISPTWAGAVPHLWDAATHDYSEAQFLLGYAYDKGTDIDRNPKAAAYWYRRATSKYRNVKAEYNLSVLLNAGEVEWQPGDPEPVKKSDLDSTAPTAPQK